MTTVKKLDQNFSGLLLVVIFIFEIYIERLIIKMKTL